MVGYAMPLADLLSQLDRRPGARGREFERICAWYLQNAPEYRDRIRIVWLWSDWPNTWGADAGIDLVAEEYDGSLWAIQAKMYDEANTVTKATMDSFIAESSRPNESGGPMFSYRLLMATTDRLSSNARRTMDDLGVGHLMRSDLERAAVEWPSSPDDLFPAALSPKTPFPHVQEAIDATVKGFKGKSRGQVIMACRTGKTLAAMWIAEKLASTRTLVLVPSLSLLKQTLREWTANSTTPFDYLAVCSDQTVVGRDEAIQHTAELGVPVTTDPAKIAPFLRRKGRRVVFATYQSSPEIAAAFVETRTPQFDLAIADEAHRCAGRMASGMFTTILDAKKIKARRRLFMTATPRFYTERLRKEAGEYNEEIASMDDETVYSGRSCIGSRSEKQSRANYSLITRSWS
jgi:predicted helicase